MTLIGYNYDIDGYSLFRNDGINQKTMIDLIDKVQQFIAKFIVILVYIVYIHIVVTQIVLR